MVLRASRTGCSSAGRKTLPHEPPRAAVPTASAQGPAVGLGIRSKYLTRLAALQAVRTSSSYVPTSAGRSTVSENDSQDPTALVTDSSVERYPMLPVADCPDSLLILALIL